MSTLTIFHLGGRWLALDGSRLVPLPAYPKLDLPAIVVSDFDNALTGVMALDAKPSMAAPLIERRLRNEGMVDGETLLEISHLTPVGRGFQALYSALPMSNWQRMVSWADSCEDHCLIVPLLTAAKRLQRPGQAIVLRHGKAVTYLSVENDAILHAETMAYSNDIDGVRASIYSLSDRVRALLGKGARPGSVLWCALDGAPDQDEQQFAAEFGKALGLDVQLAPQQTLTLPDGGQVRTSMPWLAQSIRIGDAATSRFSGLLLRAERLLPYAAAASIALALGLFGLGWHWRNQASAQSSEAGRTSAEATRIAGETQAEMRALQSDNGAADRSRQFIERLAMASEGQDMSIVLGKVRRAAQDWVSILRVRMDEVDHRLYVEGAIDKGPDGARNLALFIENLRAVGFDPVAVDPPPGTQSADYFSYALQPAGNSAPEKL